MTIAAFIRDEVLLPRLLKKGCLVVYDPVGRYRDLCASLANERIRVVDASLSSIESRKAALMDLRDIGRPKSGLDGVLVYVPAGPPVTDEDKQTDPFAIYGAAGAVFPDGDGDEYQSLCLMAKPDHMTDIRRVFAATPDGPAFAVIDAIGGGVSWPQLRSILGAQSAREILSALLVPSQRQAEALKTEGGWIDEARAFLLATLGMEIKTRAKSWGALSDEVWRFLLFSEFVFDLPSELPDTLKGVPRAASEARPIVEEVCDGLRRDERRRSIYIDQAQRIEEELNLATVCKALDDLGCLDTFPFEERTFLRTAVAALKSGDTSAVRAILTARKDSVWLEKGESQAQWQLVRASLNLIEACEDFERQLPSNSRSQGDLLDFYLHSLREADRLQREFEQASGEVIDPHGLMLDVIEPARARYSRLAEKVQTAFVRHLETSGWPPQGRLANADVFDRIVAERMKDGGRRTAYLMIDALRYELGVALERQLSEDGPVELQAAYAQLPSITLVGMASLLPGAMSGLSLALENGSLVPKLNGINVGNVPQRMDILRKRYGDRFQEMRLDDFVRGKPKIGSTIDLLVLRSTEIDSQLENNPETTLSLIPRSLQQIRIALHKLRGLGFKDAVIVTDHGFFLNGHADAGDVCVKPQGSWPITAHDRIMLGNGSSDTHSVVIPTDRLGIRGDFAQAALPRTMAPYRDGHVYFHGGASLAEGIVPVLIARLDTKAQGIGGEIKIEITYKNGAKRVTTQSPVIEISTSSDDMFARDLTVEVLIEAQDAAGSVVGEPRGGPDTNPATGTITLTSGQRRPVVLKMDAEFEGKFTVKALNPTTLASYYALPLETDYTR